MNTRRVAEILLVFLISLLASGYFHSQDDVNSNSRLALVKAIVEQDRFAIDSYQGGAFKTGDESFFGGHYYTDKGIGSSLLGAEFYSLIYILRGGAGHPLSDDALKFLITFLAISFPYAFLAPILYSLVRQISGSARYALLISLAISIGTALYIYSAAYYGHSLVALLLFAAFYIWFTMKSTGFIRPIMAFCSGCLLGFAVITEYPAAAIALVIAAYILFVLYIRKKLLAWRIYAALFLGVMIPAGALLLYNYSVFGNPLTLGYSFETVGVFRAVEHTGFMGLGPPRLGILFYMTVHTTMGIFWQSPILLLAFPGWIAMWRGRTFRLEAIISGCVVLVYFVALSGYSVWWGGLAFTPRHILPALPFLGVPLAFLAGKLRRSAFVLTIISILQMLVVIATRYDGLGNITIAYSQGLLYKMFQNSTIYSVYVPNFLAAKLVPNLGQKLFGLTGYASLFPLIAVQAGLVCAFLLAAREPGSSGSAKQARFQNPPSSLK